MRLAIVIGLIVVIAAIAAHIFQNRLESQPMVAQHADAVSPNDHGPFAPGAAGAVAGGEGAKPAVSETGTGGRPRALSLARLRVAVRNRVIAQRGPATAPELASQPQAAQQIEQPVPAMPAAPMARVALSFIGTVPEAEMVWVAAINDPMVPPEERKDLIEDLNEDGFADPKNLTPDDLPLVLSRIDLIEKHAMTAMDEVNAAAFAEAYKDLINMRDRLAQR